MRTPNQNKVEGRKVDIFLAPSPEIPADVLTSVVNELDVREVEVNAMLNDFFQTKAFGKHSKRTKQVDRATFGSATLQ
jgi:hypothetical protein